MARGRRSIRPGNVEVDLRLWLGIKVEHPDGEEDDYTPLTGLSAALTRDSVFEDAGMRFVSSSEAAGRVLTIVAWMRRRTDDPHTFSFLGEQLLAEVLDGDMSTHLGYYNCTLDAMVEADLLTYREGIYQIGADFDTYFRWTFDAEKAEG